MIANPIKGEGPAPCDVMLVGEYPGVEELRAGRPFVGKAGRELMRYLNGYDLPRREDVYLTNLKRLPPDDPKVYQVTEQEAELLWRELDTVQPSWIVTLGAHITRYFCSDEATLEAYHGIPHRVHESCPLAQYLHSGVQVFPAYNPAAALHSPSLQAALAYDMKRLGLALKRELPNAPIDKPGARYVRMVDGMLKYHPGYGRLTIAVDTEGSRRFPWCLSLSATEYFGGVVLAKDAPGVFAETLAAGASRIVLHNSLHDLGVLRALSLDLDAREIPFDDTMVMAYLLGLEPQGLKALAYRHAGMKHRDYLDVVAGPDASGAEAWLIGVRDRLPLEYEKYRKLIDRMIAKNQPETLRTRWANCRTREVLVDEQAYLVGDDTDPPEPTLDEVPLQEAIEYAGRDADATYRVYLSLKPQIAAMELEDVYATDMGVIPMIDRMQDVGIDCDLEWFRDMSTALGLEEALNRQALADATGMADFNPNSGDQVAALLFDQLKLHEQVPNLRLKYTKSRERLSTNDKVLEALEGTHAIVPLIMDGREIRKLKGTYADAIPKMVGKDGRLHPNYRITRTDTGRLSAADPNVLALPKHSKRGKLLRHGFRAGPGRVLSEFDLKQIEMVVFACDSQDEGMLESIRRGDDLHRATASEVIFNKPQDAIDDEERFAAKAVNFGIFMGITEFGLLDQLHKQGQLHWQLRRTPDNDAPGTADLLSAWHDSRPQASRYISGKHAEARQYGYVRDRFGRIRYLEGIRSTDPYIRAEAERMAQATPTQSGAQGIIKRAMKAMWPALKSLRAAGIWVECLLQVHDALLFEHYPEDTDLIKDTVLHFMCHTVRLDVPIKASAHLGVARMSELG